MAGRVQEPRTHKGGRRHKGDRHLFQSRVPVDLAATVMSEAESAGLTYSEYIAVVLAERHGYRLPEHYYPHTETDSVQEEFPMATAS